MMKFQLTAKVPTRYDDEFYSDFDCVLVSGAYRETVWEKSRWHEAGYIIHQEAALNDKGEPYIKRWNEDKKPDKQWFKYGRSHIQLEQYIWEREIECGYIYIDIVTLETLIDFLRNFDGELGSFEDDNTLGITAKFPIPTTEQDQP